VGARTPIKIKHRDSDSLQIKLELTMASLTLSGVYFRPWEGSLFRQQPIRLLLLGESHHSTEPVMPKSMTIDCTREYVDGIWSHRYWTEIMKVVEGRDYWEIDRAEFWSKVAFYNYIQEIVGEGPGIAPTDQMYRSSEQGLASVLAYLKPTHVLVLAKRLWVSLPQTIFRPYPPIEMNGKPREVKCFLVGNDAMALGTWLPHPSYPFHVNAKRLHPTVRNFLSMTIS
jgi:hypothetical protein